MNGIKPDPDIKMDPDAMTPSGSGYMDDDFYEDTGELQLPPKSSDKDIWLTRIPKWLYEAVSKWDDLADGNDDDEITIGEVLYIPDQARQGRVSKDHPLRVFLNDKWHDKKQLPRAFELKMPEYNRKEKLEYVSENTYVFTEKDLPGYKRGGLGQGKLGSSSNLGVQDANSRVQKRSRYKKAIPKQTALIGSATREYIANPLNTPEFVKFNKNRTMLAIQGKEVRTNIVDSFTDHTASQNVQKMFKTFIRPVQPVKTQLNKAARIPKNELRDLLHRCFDEFAYWPMKALKARVQQPEAYLKEVLAEIADLVKSGSFASCWVRKAMYNHEAINQVKDKPLWADQIKDEDENEDDMEMEDVV